MDEHINKVVTRANSSIGFLKRNLQIPQQKINPFGPNPATTGFVTLTPSPAINAW